MVAQDMTRRQFPDAVVSKNTGTHLTDTERERFTWGRVVAIHDIGEYRIIEFLNRKVDGCTVTKELTDEHLFFVEGSSQSCHSLDGALAAAIACKHEGLNSQAARYFMKMISAED